MARTLLLGLLVACVACGSDSSGPSGPTGPVFASPAAFARHIDSLYQGFGPYGSPQGSPRAQFLEWLEYSAAFGGTPGKVLVATTAGPELWNTYVWAIVDTNYYTAIFIVAGYRDANVSEGFLADVQTGPNFAGGQGGEVILYNGNQAVQDSGQLSFSGGAPVGPCTTASGLTDAAILLAETYKCQLVPYTVSITATGDGVLNGKPSETISFTLSGVIGPLLESTGDE